ncbi:MAG: gluconate 2-dehydrogenase subunit 3 family protein [Cyclobacteriaceae bacterium]
MIDRRTAIKRTAMIMGGALSSSAIFGVLNGCTAEKQLDWQPVFLSKEQAAATAELTERIIPRTETPGAKDVGVPEFIDMMLNEIYTEEEKQRFLDGLAQLDKDSENAFGDKFADLSMEQQDEVLQKMAVASQSHQGEGKPFFLMAKELTMLGFFTSEIGATQVLQYEQVPGRYEGCIPIEQAGNGKTWAF